MNQRSRLNSMIWEPADKWLRNNVEPQAYGDYILPFVVLRRLECVIAEDKPEILDHLRRTAGRDESQEVVEQRVAAMFGVDYYNSSPLDLGKIAAVDQDVLESLMAYVDGFSSSVSDIWDAFGFKQKAKDLDEAGVLHGMVSHFASIDLSGSSADDLLMGEVFEDLMYRAFSRKGKGAGEFYTPRDAVELMVQLLLTSDDPGLVRSGARHEVYDPTAGTAGMLLVAKRAMERLNPAADVQVYGQELMRSSYAIGKADLVIQGEAPDALRQGDTLVKDEYEGQTFDYILSNPPFGGDWTKSKAAVEEQAQVPGSRFSHGLPGKSDAQILFLCHVASKLRPAGKDGSGGRACVVTNGSPFFSNVAGTGKIREWLLTSDLVEAIVALPTSMFYGTSIATYVWVLDANKEARRRGKVQLIDATGRHVPMAKAMGEKRRQVTPEHQAEVVKDYVAFEDSETSRVLSVEDFGYRDVVVTRPLRLGVEVSDRTVEAALDHKSAATDHRQVVEAMAGKRYNELPEALKAEARKAGLKMPVPLIDHMSAALAVVDPDAELAVDRKGRVLTDGWSMVERVPLGEDVDEHMEREVLPFAPDVVWDVEGAATGYEVPFARIFFKPVEPRPLEEIDADVQRAMDDLMRRFQEVKA